MTEMTKRVGSCLCGAVHITAHRARDRVGVCHCSMCRTWGGGPLMAVDCGVEVEIEGKNHVTVFESSDWAERGFCSVCGSNLFYRVKQSGAYFMAAGIFSDQTGFTFDHQVFIDEKPDYYDFANQTHDMTGAEVFAKWSGG